jgi:hypothetical protein
MGKKAIMHGVEIVVDDPNVSVSFHTEEPEDMPEISLRQKIAVIAYNLIAYGRIYKRSISGCRFEGGYGGEND